MVIAHPPCTYLANSGVWVLHRDKERWDSMREGAEFFLECLNANAPLVAVENPTMHKYAIEIVGRKPDCAVQPYHFGHNASKRTCFWTKNLPPLLPTQIDAPSLDWWHETRGLSTEERRKRRSYTYPGIAAAMAHQWG